MDKFNVSEKISHNRRRFLSAAAISMAAAQLGIFSSEDAEALAAAMPGAKSLEKARSERIIRPAQADQCRPPECWIRRSGARQWFPINSSARLALRYSQLR